VAALAISFQGVASVMSSRSAVGAAGGVAKRERAQHIQSHVWEWQLIARMHPKQLHQLISLQG
jgi:hypothetical protein